MNVSEIKALKHMEKGYLLQNKITKARVFYAKKDIDYICIDYDLNCIRVKLKGWTEEKAYPGYHLTEVM